MSAKPTTTEQTFHTLHSQLRQTHPAPLLPPSKPYSSTLSHDISSLSVHPTLESALHILNNDLASAHFLVRHMQAPPAYEGMLLHGILHRVEGDYDNARAWYEAVSESEVFGRIWPRKEDAWGFLADVERLRRDGVGDREGLEGQSRREIDAVVGWCAERFGVERWLDATGVWVRPGEKVKAIGEDMVTGDAGRRRF